MATSIARAKDSSAIGKAKRAPSSNSQATSTSTKENTKLSTRSSSSDHKATTSEKRIPNYLKPTIRSRFESHSYFFKPLKSDSATQKPTPTRRPSFEKPASPSNLPKRKELSSSRLHKALVSPGPPHKTLPLVRSTSTPTPLKSTISSKLISRRTSKTPKDAKPHPILYEKSVNSRKTAPTTKKVADASANSTMTPESADTTAETSSLETAPQVTNQESKVLKVEDDQRHEVEKVSEIPPRIDSTEHEHEQHHKLESDQTHIQAHDERVIPSVSEDEPISVTEVEKAKEEPQEEKIKDEHGEEESTSQGESNNERHPEERSATDGEVEVKEKEKEGEIIKDGSENNNEEKALEEKEGEERGINEDKIDDDEIVTRSEVAEAKAESAPPKQEAGKESQAYNNVIEETASKLLETRKNKVRALAGAFQIVIDYQTSSK